MCRVTPRHQEAKQREKSNVALARNLRSNLTDGRGLTGPQAGVDPRPTPLAGRRHPHKSWGTG